MFPNKKGKMKKYLIAVCGILISLADANAVRTAPQRTPDLALKIAAKNAEMAAAQQAQQSVQTEHENNPTPTVQTNESTARATTGAAAVNMPVPNTSGSIGTVTDDVRPVDKDTEKIRELNDAISQRQNYRNYLIGEIAKIDAQMIECESSKGKWKAATIIGGIGVAATGAAAIIQSQNHKNQKKNETKDEKK